MKDTVPALFEETLQKTHAWLSAIERELGVESPREALRALRATLHALRDQLPLEEAVHLGAQLPLLVRGIYYEGWRPGAPRHPDRHREAFVAAVAHALGPAVPPVDGEGAARAVFRVLASRLTAGEIHEVRQLLPRELRELWP